MSRPASNGSAARPGGRTNLRSASLALAGLLLAQGVLADNCESPQHRQFDFWIGQWHVENPAGEVVGHNRIEPILEGCALMETWQGGSGYNGQSLNTWDPVSGHWRQFWTDNHDLTLHLSGNWQEDRMVLEGTRRDTRGRKVTDRISWTPLEEGVVRQHWQQSVDGTGFKTVFDGRYVPVEANEEAD